MSGRIHILFEITCVIVCAYFLAASANTLLAPGHVSLRVETNVSSQNNAASSVPPFSSFSPILQRNLFDVFDPSSVKKKKKEPAPAKLTDLAVAKVNATLLGTIYSNQPELRRAIIEFGGEQKLMAAGEKVQQLTIAEIQRRAVVLKQGNREQLLLIDQNDAQIAEENKYLSAVPRKWIESQMDNIAALARSIHLKPTDYGDKGAGVLVYNMTENSPFRRLGLEVGDLILEANGKSTLQYRNPIEAFRLLDTEKLTLKILRRGKTHTQSYTLVD